MKVFFCAILVSSFLYSSNIFATTAVFTNNPPPSPQNTFTALVSQNHLIEDRRLTTVKLVLTKMLTVADQYLDLRRHLVDDLIEFIYSSNALDGSLNAIDFANIIVQEYNTKLERVSLSVREALLLICPKKNLAAILMLSFVAQELPIFPLTSAMAPYQRSLYFSVLMYEPVNLPSLEQTVVVLGQREGIPFASFVRAGCDYFSQNYL